MRFIYFIVFIFIGLACSKTEKDLPFIGEKTADNKNHTVGEFSFLNQDSTLISQTAVTGKVYVADFFFTSCPTICPVMKTQMLRVHEKFKSNENFLILSHSIDPEHDSLSVLKAYKKGLVGNAPNWHFLRAEKIYTHTLAQNRYFVSALEDPAAKADGGFVHSGAFVLIDKKGHIRGVYDGTKEDQVNKLINDIPLLLTANK